MQTNPANAQTQIDALDPARARALQVTLGHPPTLQIGDPLPLFAHHAYFWDPQPETLLGPDGHPATGGDLIPDLGLSRRMWAAGHLIFHAPLLAGIRAEKTSVIDGITRKTGRSGPLAFVRIRHDLRQRQGLVLTEWQELVYRPAGRPSDANAPTERTAPHARSDETLAETVTFSTTQLFRYSALTFNGHRIHYDLDYAREIEGYGGLVVHGPLLAQLLLDLAQRQLGEIKTFAYRATSPLLHHDTATLCWKDGAAWVRGPHGEQCMTAKAT